VTLKWYAGLWAHKYDIYFGTTPTLTSANLVAADVQLGPSETTTSFISFTVPGPLAPGTTNYWQVVSRTMANLTATGPVWSLVTAGGSGGSTLPAGWSSADIGAVGAAGNATFDSNTGQFVVSGSGADIWGTNDAFRFAFTTMTGDGSIVARVSGLTNEDAWTKAGVMMRDTLADNSAQAMMVVSSGKGLAFQRRTAAGGTSTSTSGGGGTAPYWVKLTRTGNTFSAFASSDGSNWSLVGSDTIAMGSSINVGLAVTSHKDGTVSTGTFDNVNTGSGSVGGGLPNGWSSRDVGAVGAAGNATYDDATGQFAVSGSGADIWGTSDEFRFAFTTMTGDGSIVARVASLTNENAWTKAGVMMRDSLTASSAQAMIVVSSAKGLAFQRRTTTGGESTNTSGGAGTAPYWVKLTRTGNTFTAFVSTDGSSWNLVGSDTIAMGSSINVGLAITSHADGVVSTATFDNVSTSSDAASGQLPTGWSSSDVGAVGAAGNATFDANTNTFSVRGAGADVWGTADAFRFAYTTLAGDGAIVARVASVQNVNSWTKAGVMMRDGLDAGAAHAAMFATPSTIKGTAFQRRPTANGTSVSTPGPVVAPPYWVRIVRQGTTFSAYTSPDGASWSLVDTETIAMANTVNVGLAVSSHVSGTPATASFTDVTVTPQ
jgi:regulation of enolase protein 1 (concanavalin A-like superfamily)